VQLPGPDYPAPAKLNLFLHVVGRRADGYHELQSVFVLIDLADRLRFRVRPDGRVVRLNDVRGVAAEEDLSVRAASALKAAAGTHLGADIELEKHIPLGSGLGGGSSDAATALMALNRLWKCGLAEAQLRRIGEGLGADVPFFVGGRNAWVEGTGERLTPIEIPQRWYVVLRPPVEVPTRAIFAALELTRNTEALKMEDFSAHSPVDVFFGRDARVGNDLEPVVVSRYPVVGEHLAWLARFGKARMTGSGSCVFAAFQSRAEAQAVFDALPGRMQGFVAQGLRKHPLHE
jgi:4-diphosphocytidyl-2-C-methyl-D-erythritol kinase